MVLRSMPSDVARAFMGRAPLFPATVELSAEWVEQALRNPPSHNFSQNSRSPLPDLPSPSLNFSTFNYPVKDSAIAFGMYSSLITDDISIALLQVRSHLFSISSLPLNFEPEFWLTASHQQSQNGCP